MVLLQNFRRATMRLPPILIKRKKSDMRNALVEKFEIELLVLNNEKVKMVKNYTME